MAFEIKTSILIQASSEKIWDKLSEFSKYADWNPFIKSIEGNVSPGEQIKVSVEGMSFKPLVLVIEEYKRLEWRGKLISSFLFEGTHLFDIEDHQNGNCSCFRHIFRFI